MARVTGKNGAVSFLTGYNADFNRWDLSFTHPVDDDTSYTDTGVGASHSGSGTVDYNIGAFGFLKSNVSTTAPNFGSVTVSGGAVTLTAHTGCTEAGTFILTGGAINHAKRAGAIPVSYSGIGDSDLTETWAVS